MLPFIKVVLVEDARFVVCEHVELFLLRGDEFILGIMALDECFHLLPVTCSPVPSAWPAEHDIARLKSVHFTKKSSSDSAKIVQVITLELYFNSKNKYVKFISNKADYKPVG